jgi:predicted GNAT family acetyltransferase
MAIDAQTQVTEDPDAERFHMTLDGEPIGFLQYQHVPGRVVLEHVEIDKRFEGRGLGGELTKAALDEFRARGVAVVPQCPFIARYIRSHPEYTDMVAR